MKIDELLYEEFTKLCDEQEDCSLCKYCGDFSCQLSFGYSKGRVDKYQEIVSEYMLLTEKQVAEIRADAIDEFAEKIMDIMPNDIDVKVHNGSICLDILALAEQLKEQDNG